MLLIMFNLMCLFVAAFSNYFIIIMPDKMGVKFLFQNISTTISIL